MQILVERGCGLDVHQATVVACLLIVLKNGTVQKQIRTFGTTTRELISPARMVALRRLHPFSNGEYRCLLEADIRDLGGSFSNRSGKRGAG
jgi:hypothetical protein